MSGKRANGEGSLYRRPDGLWQCTIMEGFQANGKRKYKTFYGKTQAEAKKKRNAYQREKDDGLSVEKEYPFTEWADLWFDSHKDNISPNTQENYKYTLRILEDYFSRKKLAAIKAYDIEQFLKKLQRDGRSDSSVAKCRGMLFQIFNKAEANDLIKKNPVRFAEKLRSEKKPMQRKESFTFDETKRLMDYLPEDKIGWSIRLMLGTGMRTQELLALEPRHISEDGSTITIEQAVVMVKGSAKVGTPKSNDSYRVIPVPENVRYCARLLRDTGKKFIWEGGIYNMPCNPSWFRKQFRLALEFVGDVRILTPHCCRHTYVSQMQALGVDLATIQSIVGHADMDMTMHYLHVQAPIREAAIQKFNDAFSSKSSQASDGTVDLQSCSQF